MVPLGDEIRQDVQHHQVCSIGDRRAPVIPSLVWFALVVILALSFVSFRTASAQNTQNQGPPPGSMPQSLQDKIQQLQGVVQRLQQQGTDVQPVGELTQGLPPLIEQQKFAEAEALVDRALKIAGGLTPPAGQTAQKEPSPTARPRSLFLRNQIWGSLRVTITDRETGRLLVLERKS